MEHSERQQDSSTKTIIPSYERAKSQLVKQKPVNSKPKQKYE